jgi:hypothetical protein
MDFSSLRGSKISVLKETKKDAEKRSKSYNSGRRPDFLSIDEGLNFFRIAPPSSPELPSYFPLRTCWLECEVPKLNDEGEEIKKNGQVETEKKKKRIFIATIHSDTMTSDPVEKYVEYVYKRANDEFSDKDAKAKFLAPVTGYKDKKGVWTPGMRANTNYVFYAWKNGNEFGRLEIYPQILKRMDELSISEDKEEVIEIDPFSDPVEGCSLIIDYDKSAKAGEKYVVSKKTFDFTKYLKKAGGDEKKAFELYNQDKESEKLTQEMLEEWYSKETLVSMYKNVYSMRDFDLAINGLKIFDDTHEYHIFDNDEFIAELEKIQATVPEKVETEEKPEATDNEETETPKTSTSTKQPEKSANNHSDWNKIKCRKKLTAYILENYGNDEVLPEDMLLEDMQAWCDLVDQEEELPFAEYAKTIHGSPSKDSSVEKEVVTPSKPAIEPNKDFDKEEKSDTGVSETQAQKIANLRKKSEELKLKK